MLPEPLVLATFQKNVAKTIGSGHFLVVWDANENPRAEPGPGRARGTRDAGRGQETPGRARPGEGARDAGQKT